MNRRAWRIGVWPRVLASVAFLSAAALAQEPVDFHDQEFEDADWTSTVLEDTTQGTGSVQASREASGGIGDSARRKTTHELVSGKLLVGHLAAGATYDPSSSGAIQHVTAGFQLRFDEPYGSSMDVHLLVAQGGSHFVSEPFEVTGDWERFVFEELDAADFQNVAASAPASPDFGQSGGPISLGFATATSAASGQATSVCSIDDWVVLVHETNATAACRPEPRFLWAPEFEDAGCYGLHVWSYRERYEEVFDTEVEIRYRTDAGNPVWDKLLWPPLHWASKAELLQYSGPSTGIEWDPTKGTYWLGVILDFNFGFVVAAAVVLALGLLAAYVGLKKAADNGGDA